MLPQVYDLLKKVGDIMVRSELQGVREKAGLVYCKFMLEYPLGERVASLSSAFRAVRGQRMTGLGLVWGPFSQRRIA